MSSGDTCSLSVVRYNANNSWYVNLNNGNMNNNNVYNRYVVASVSELSENIDVILQAEKECYKNKHNSIDAARIHYRLFKINNLAKVVFNNTWTQGIAYMFVCFYPTIREIWASFYPDRILHHLVAPTLIKIAEKIHTENGDVSHGNRLNHSAETAALQIMNNMNMFLNGYIGKRDFSGFFMSINREIAFNIVESMCDDKTYIDLIKKLLLDDPTKHCVIKSPKSDVDLVPANKSLFNAEDGCGLPLGNFYSQIVAGIFLYKVDALHLTPKYIDKIKYTRFVDDMTAIGDNPQIVNEFFNDVEKIAKEFKLTIHPRKKYLQPVLNGVSFCGRTIKPNRIYMNNRVIKSIKNIIKVTPNDLNGAEQIVKSINSYFGFLSHCMEFKMQSKFAKEICTKWSKYVYYVKKHNQLVFYLNRKYRTKSRCIYEINLFKQNIKKYSNKFNGYTL